MRHTRKVLVTGASGFLGSRLMQRLRTEPGLEPMGTLRHSSEAGGSADGYIQIKKIDQSTDWSAALSGVSAVIHTAARAHVLRDIAPDPLSAFRQVNVAGTLSLARQSAQAQVRRFVFVSSIGVNGNESLRPFTETDSPAPVGAYAVSKYEAEIGLQMLAEETGMEVTIIRPPLVYGPDAPGNFGRLVRWVASGVPLPLGAVRDNRRSFVSLENLVDLIATCLRHQGAANEVFLAGDGEDLSTAELLERLAWAMGRPSRLLPLPVWMLESAASMLGKRNVARQLCGSLQVDISKARDVLGWTPPVSVDQGLRRAVSNKL